MVTVEHSVLTAVIPKFRPSREHLAKAQIEREMAQGFPKKMASTLSLKDIQVCQMNKWVMDYPRNIVFHS